MRRLICRKLELSDLRAGDAKLIRFAGGSHSESADEILPIRLPAAVGVADVRPFGPRECCILGIIEPHP